MNTTTTTCSHCDYNLPYHGLGCPAAPRELPFCPDHAGDRVRGRGSDDARLTCTVCKTNGQHVGYFRDDR